MNIYRRELKAHRKPLLIWSACMLFLVAAGMGKYSSQLGTGLNINDLMQTMPAALQKFFGLGVLDLSVAVEYFGVLFTYIALVAAVHAAMLGAEIVSKEERDKTAEFLMAKPVSRARILTAKLAAALTNVLALNLFTAAGSFGVLNYYSQGAPFAGRWGMLMAALLAVQAFFLATGVFFASLTGKHSLATGAATGLLLLLFVIFVITDIFGRTDFLRYLTPFKFFDAKVLMAGKYENIYTLITVLCVAAFVFFAYRFYRRRDLKV